MKHDTKPVNESRTLTLRCTQNGPLETFVLQITNASCVEVDELIYSKEIIVNDLAFYTHKSINEHLLCGKY